MPNSAGVTWKVQSAAHAFRMGAGRRGVHGGPSNSASARPADHHDTLMITTGLFLLSQSASTAEAPLKVRLFWRSGDAPL